MKANCKAILNSKPQTSTCARASADRPNSKLEIGSWNLGIPAEWRAGQSMVEVVVAIGVAVILAVSLVTASLVTQRAARSARNSTQATKLVQQNIEQMRVFRDRKGYSALSDGVCFTLNTTDSNPANWILVTCITGEVITLNNTNFTRKIGVVTDGVNTNKKLVTVTASWPESGITRTVAQDTFLSKWESP